MSDPSRSVLLWQVCDGSFESGTECGEVELREMRVGKEDVGRRFES